MFVASVSLVETLVLLREGVMLGAKDAVSFAIADEGASVAITTDPEQQTVSANFI